ncbi:TetR/AcrR family transcriptional regulator [Streptomyces sp. SBT349]|uniref:TetR/AcrR family transcriptional regulator n=1 Tax=Streptomyces sp. SBT349 TaxID=1580539 RepID=UPI0007C6B521|nr:TetR/AcrR family transcriptional regulator [Streptomyces sp. SBT349]
MPTARDSLLRAAGEAVERRSWQVVRMVEVAAAAGVSRQTLYNEFGDKAGLGAALAAHRTGALLDGFAAFCLARRHLPAAEALAGATAWIVQAAGRDRVVHASLTGCRCAGLPPMAAEPGHLVSELTDRARGALPAADPARCETAVRVAVSHLVAPAPAPTAASGPVPGPGSRPRPV